VRALRDFSFTKIVPGTKRPVLSAWQKSPLSFQEIENEPAYGILSGYGGFLAGDCDSPMAIAKLIELFDGWIPDTWSWSSGKEGRCQFGFFVPEAYRHKLTQARYWEKMPDGGQLDFRWKGCQSVLPPSPHPETGGYIWEQSPEDFDLAIAPEWLIDYAVSLKAKKSAGVKVPAEAYKIFGAPLKLWALLHIYAQGSGRAEFSLQMAANHLDRGKSTVWRLLEQAEMLGLIRRYKSQGDQITAYPTALLKVARLAGLESLGTIFEINFEDFLGDVRNLNIKCTEAIAAAYQRQSLWQAKAAQKDVPKNEQKVIVDPINPADPGKRVLWSGPRYTAISEGTLPFGASQQAIAKARGLCVQTVSRHLSNSYRCTPSPVKGARLELGKIEKTQLLQRVPVRLNDLVAHAEAFGLEDKFLRCGNRWYRVLPNIYESLTKPIRCKCHRKSYIANLQQTPGEGKEGKSVKNPSNQGM
jgi:hypothetical protein